ncbi:MAG: hypothetical protein WC495_05890 [Patescibacteria group bacterium]
MTPLGVKKWDLFLMAFASDSCGPKTMNKQIKTAKRRRKYYTMKKKKEDRTKLYDRIRFLKTFNKVDEKGNVLIPSRYYLPFVKAINCYSCKYFIKNTMPKDCEHYDPIYLRLEDVEKDNSKKINPIWELRWFCKGHEFRKRLVRRKYRPFETPLTSPKRCDIIKP